VPGKIADDAMLLYPDGVSPGFLVEILACRRSLCALRLARRAFSAASSARICFSHIEAYRPLAVSSSSCVPFSTMWP
jgi:hypothetical protein